MKLKTIIRYMTLTFFASNQKLKLRKFLIDFDFIYLQVLLYNYLIGPRPRK